jgi:esterase/lipase superfamily enzyme
MANQMRRLVNELESIELLLNDAGVALKRDGIVSPDAWRAICRANTKGKWFRAQIHELRGDVATRDEWTPLTGIDYVFNGLSQLWAEIAISIRDTPRIDRTDAHADAPIAVGRIRELRNAVARKRYDVTRILQAKPALEEEAADSSKNAHFREPNVPDWWQRLGADDPLYEAPPPRGEQMMQQQMQGVVEPVLVQYDWVESIVPSSIEGARDQAAVIDYVKTRHYDVWFGTNRRELSKPRGYSDKECGPLVFGQCSVYVPHTHKFGSLGSGWIVRGLRRFTGHSDVDDRIKIITTSSLDADEWIGSLDAAIAKWSRSAALVIVHGYNVTFDEAARRSAQIGFDLRIDGIVAFFSWPSRGRIFPYTSDEESVQIAEPHFVEFLATLSKTSGLQEINILAHSMGNRLLLRTMRSIAELNDRAALPVRIGQIILAAADVPTEVFDHHAPFYTQTASKRVTSYSCNRDIPLMASRFLHQRSRVGLEPPIYIVRGMDSISAGALDIHGLGHGYYAETEALLYDLSELIHHNDPPSRRTRIEPGPPERGECWVISR